MDLTSLSVAGLLVGLFAGILGGMFGIGGGLVIVPALVLIFAMPLKTATGTSLVAQLLPVGLLGVLAYYRRGEVRFGMGLSVAAGLFLGMLAGAQLAGYVPASIMRRLYGVFLLVVAAYFILLPGGVQERPKRGMTSVPERSAAGETGESAGQAVH